MAEDATIREITVHIKLDETNYAVLLDLARQEEVSVNDLVGSILEAYLEVQDEPEELQLPDDIDEDDPDDDDNDVMALLLAAQ